MPIFKIFFHYISILYISIPRSILFKSFYYPKDNRNILFEKSSQFNPKLNNKEWKEFYEIIDLLGDAMH